MRRSRIYYCAAAGCKVNTRTHPLERLFRFPRSSRNLARYLKWVEFSKNPRLRRDKPVEAYMCARHFTRNQFRTEYQMTLVYQAVPSIPPEECSEESYSAKCKFKAPYLATDDDDMERMTPCSSSDQFLLDRMSSDEEEEDCFLEAGDEMKMEEEEEDDDDDDKCMFISGGMIGLEEEADEQLGDGGAMMAAHVWDHSYSTRLGLESWSPVDTEDVLDADHNYYSNTKQEDVSPPQSPPPEVSSSPQVLLSELVPEEHPWFKITLPGLPVEERPPEDNQVTSSIREDEVEDEEDGEDPLAPPVREEEVSTEDREAEVARAPGPAKIEMSAARYKAFVQRERFLAKTLKKKDRALRRIAHRYREKCAKIKELTGSNTELTKLVEALSNSVSVCCDLLGIHDVVFKT